MSRPVAVAEGFTPVPSLERPPVSAQVVASLPTGAAPLGVLVPASGPVPASLGLDREALSTAGFTGKAGSTTAVAGSEGVRIAIGVGDPDDLDATAVRDAAGRLAGLTGSHAEVAIELSAAGAVDAAVAVRAAIEGLVLGRYRYTSLQREPEGTDLTSITLIAGDDQAARQGIEPGLRSAAAGALARDLANSPPAHLTATRIADLAVELGASRGLSVEVFDRDALVEMGCGGLLGVNAGSSQPPRMVRLRYRPPGGDGVPHLTFVGKGIMYDSGGLSLKPGDAVHATMKNDMTGAAAVLAAMSELAALGCTSAVTGYLMCTDNLPSGTALALGDVLTVRGGTTVEVVNTDAEGRLVMSDALVLATEEPVDAVVDIATLTGACMRALGTQVGGLFGTDDGLVAQLSDAGDRTDERLWRLPLEERYRSELDSDVADLKNLGGANAGAITAALFLKEFVGDVPWAHVDIAGTAQSEGASPWHTKGCTGFGARLLLDMALRFAAPSAG